MKIRILPMMMAAMMFAAGALAHTHLTKSTPADNAVLETAPASLELHFSEATRLTALSVQQEGAGQKQDLGPLPREPSAALSVPLKPLAPGKYTVNWRAVGDDNHVMSGALHFTVSAP